MIGIAVQIPFMNTRGTPDPVAGELGGADLSWIIGLDATGPGYYLLARNRALAPSELAMPPA